MDYLKVILTSSFSIIAIFLLTRLMGKKQISQLNLFDYVNGITIGSIAAEMATELEQNFLLPLLAMIVYALFSVAFTYLERKSVKLNKFIFGTSDIIFENGVLYEKNLIKGKLSISEFLSQLRTAGYFDLNEVEAVILEPNGVLSVLPKAPNRPVVPADLQLNPEKAELLPNVILDGQVMHANLRSLGYDEKWLQKQLSLQKVKSPDEVFLAVCNRGGELTVFKKTHKRDDREPFI